MEIAVKATNVQRLNIKTVDDFTVNQELVVT